MTTLTNPCLLTRIQTNLHTIINMESLGQNCRPLSCKMSLVARSKAYSELLAMTVFLKRFLKRKNKITVEELMLSQKEKGSFK